MKDCKKSSSEQVTALVWVSLNLPGAEGGLSGCSGPFSVLISGSVEVTFQHV